MQTSEDPCDRSNDPNQEEDIPSYHSFCKGLDSQNSQKSFIALSQTMHHHHLLSETILEADYKMSAQFNPFSPKKMIKKQSQYFQLDKENKADYLAFLEGNEKKLKSLDRISPKELIVSNIPDQIKLNFNLSDKTIDFPQRKKPHCHFIFPTEDFCKGQGPKAETQSSHLGLPSPKYFACYEDRNSDQVPIFSILKDKKNFDLNFITSDTLQNLMMTSNQVRVILLDCRYEYEFLGGHIQGAIHIPTPETLQATLFDKSIREGIKVYLDKLKINKQASKELETANATKSEGNKAKIPIIVFYSEFFQKRASRALRYFQSQEKDSENNQWLNSPYPYIYILEGGYKKFHSDFPGDCTRDGGYVEMLDIRYKNHFLQAKENEQKAWRIKKNPELNKLGNLILQGSKRKLDF